VSLDPTIRSLAKSVAKATVEYVVEILDTEGHYSVAHGLRSVKVVIAGQIAEATMGAAEDDPESEVNALRELAGGGA
jgi:hypothetical protein